MKHITKILAVVMAVVFLSGQVVYAGDLRQLFKRFQAVGTNTTAPVATNSTLPSSTTALTSGNMTGNEATRSLPKPIEVLGKIGMCLVPPVAIGVIGAKMATDSDFRQQFIEGARKIGSHLAQKVASFSRFGPGNANDRALRMGHCTRSGGLSVRSRNPLEKGKGPLFEKIGAGRLLDVLTGGSGKRQ